MKPKRIDQFLPSFAPRDAIGIHVTNLRGMLRQRGFESDIFAIGEDFLPRAQQILRGVEEAQLALSALEQGVRGRLSVGVIPTIMPYFLAPRLVGFTAANRVDMEDFSQRGAWLPGGEVAGQTTRTIRAGVDQFSGRALPRGPAGYISCPTRASGEAVGAAEGMDTTLRATTESSPRGETDE